MVEFETIKKEEKFFGKNKFIEVARRKAITEEGENEFISIVRGFINRDGKRKIKSSITIPDNKEIREFVSNAIKTF